MKYFGIKSPEDGRIWWIAEDSHRSWCQFFQHMPSRSPLGEAIKAYEAIGYRCVELMVKELDSIEPDELECRALLKEASDATWSIDGVPCYWTMSPSWRERAAKLIGK